MLAPKPIKPSFKVDSPDPPAVLEMGVPAATRNSSGYRGVGNGLKWTLLLPPVVLPK